MEDDDAISAAAVDANDDGIYDMGGGDGAVVAADADADTNAYDTDADDTDSDAAAAAADDDDDDNDDELDDATAIQTLISILCEKDEFPAQQRNGTIADLARTFLHNFKSDVYDMITNEEVLETNEDILGNHRGLDSTRDTEAEVEKVLRIFPDLLSKRKTTKYGLLNIYELMEDEEEEEEFGWVETEDDDGKYPIQCLASTFSNEDDKFICDEKAVPFVHLFAQLAIEFNSFDDEHRGGLLIEDYNEENVLQHHLTENKHSVFASSQDRQRVDRIFLTQLIRLRQSDLLTKQDVRTYKLIDMCVGYRYESFPDSRFQFLTEWNPRSLISMPAGHLEHVPSPLQVAASNGMQSFRIVFEAGIRFFPKKKGIHLLFESADHRYYQSPFVKMCTEFEQKNVMDVVEDVLSRYSTTALLPENMMEPLLSACTDRRIHLNCVYFLLRRVPTVLSGLQLPSRRRVNSNNYLNARRNNKETNTNNENTDAGDKRKRHS